MNGDSSNYWLELLGLGLAAFDPTIALVALVFILASVRNRIVYIFASTAVVTTWVLGVALSLTIGQLTAIPRGLNHLRHGPIRAELEIVIFFCGLIWLAIRVRRGPDDSEPKPPNATERGAVLVALAIVLVNMADPPFLGGVIVAGQSPNMADVLLGVLLLTGAVQFPLMIVAAIMFFGSPQKIAERFNTWWLRTAPQRFQALNLLAAALLGAMAIDAIHYLIHTSYAILNESGDWPRRRWGV